MTPAVNNCNLGCLFCWRDQTHWGEGLGKVDDPEVILEESLMAQRSLVSGYKGDSRVAFEKWKEACEPRHVAISLTGEPTLYPRLGELVSLFHRKGMTTFLVTNGTTPKVLERLDPLPTQLYVTVAAPNEEIYKGLCAPNGSGSWSMLMKTLEILPSLDTRKVIRHTLVDGWNLGMEDEYAKLDQRADPTFIETKGYVYVGASRDRLMPSNMPSHKKIKRFASRLAAITGYEIREEREDSRAVLLSQPDVEARIAS